MKRWATRLVIAALLAAAAIWLWRVVFPPPEAAIRKRLADMARLASFDQNEQPFAKLGNATELASFFTSDAEIVVDLRGRPEGRLSGRDNLLQAAMGVRQNLMSLKVEFPDIAVELLPGKTKAVVNLTATARAGGDPDIMVQELKFILEKDGRTWFVRRVETVRTLSMARPRSRSPLRAGH